MKLIKEGIFSEGILQNEFFIPVIINLNDDKVKYYERLNWDILNNNLTPENFAEQIIIDENLTYEYINIISLQIRKQIKNYVFNLFENMSKNYYKYNQKEFLENYNKRNRRKDDKHIITFLFDSKLENLLGNKRYREINSNNNEKNLLLECNSNIIRIDKELFYEIIESNKNNINNKKRRKLKELEQTTFSDKNSGNTETLNNSKSNSKHSKMSLNNLKNLEKELNGKTKIHIVDNKFENENN